MEELPERFKTLFSAYSSFNRVQNAVFPDLMYTNDSIVVTAPTGSGKTVLFELAVVKLIIDNPGMMNMKAIYVAPVKALCSERFNDWSSRFEKLGIKCIQVTGDSMDDVNLNNYHLILTTPEKWDSLTRRWQQNVIKLMMIDEVHLLNDEKRGPILETIVCRMKTLQTNVRFIAVSATIYNLDDLGQWLNAKTYKFGNEMRPVLLKRVVRSYPQAKNQSPYLFDLQLSYKIKQILVEFSEGKPALIFCSTRRGVVQTSQTLSDQLNYEFTAQQNTELNQISLQITDTKLGNFVKNGIGYHHAGLSPNDKNIIQDFFTRGSLPVLVATTTLAMGVNLPAHLVIIKSTHQYNAGRVTEYPETYILQMIGRAGRPQFDTTATAVIMTRSTMAQKYENLLECKEILESSLHKNLAENLNSEIVLYTITDLGVAMDWIRSTFLYQRAFKNPKFYNLTSKIDKELETMVLRELNALKREELIELTNGMDIKPTTNGRLMSHYYLNFKTFQIFKEIGQKKSMKNLLTMLSNAHEFNEIQLRVNEKKILNDLNSSKNGKIRYPMIGKIKTNEMKINCLVQACLGCLVIQDPGLLQETGRIINILERIVKCLIEYLSKLNDYVTFYNAVLLAKCLHAKLWENSVFVARQLDRIGPALGNSLVNADKTNFEKLLETHPFELERIVNRCPPFGTHIIDQIRKLPIYKLNVLIDRQTILSCNVVVNVTIGNAAIVCGKNTAGNYHTVMIIIGDTNNRLIHQRRVPDSTILNGNFSFSTFVTSPLPKKIFVKVISQQWVGIDVEYEEIVNPMAKDLLEDEEFKKPLKKKRNVKKKKNEQVSGFDLEPVFNGMDENEQILDNSDKWEIKEIVEPFNPQPISFDLVDYDEIFKNSPEFPQEDFSTNDEFSRNDNFSGNDEFFEQFSKTYELEENLEKIPDISIIEQKIQENEKIEQKQPEEITFELGDEFFEQFPVTNELEENLEKIPEISIIEQKIQENQIIEQQEPEEITFDLGIEFLSQEFEEPQIAIKQNSPKKQDCEILPYSVNAQWPGLLQFKKNISLKRLGADNSKPLKKLKSLKDFFPLVKAVRNLTNTHQ